MATISSNRFDYSAKTRSFTADASDLRNVNFLGQLWKDSADTGFMMESARTGNVVTFYLANEERNDGDVMYWEFKPVENHVGDITVTIFNT